MARKKRVSVKAILVVLIIIALCFLVMTFVYDPLTGRAVRSSSTDKIAPNITIQSPIDGSSVAVGSSMKIRAAASDNRGVREINLYLNGVKVKRCSYSTSCQYSFIVKEVKNYQISANAKDSAGNVATGSVTAYGIPIVTSTTCTEPLTETRTTDCGSGYTGLITESRTKGPAPDCTWSSWTQTSNTCVAIVPPTTASCPAPGNDAFTTCFYNGINFDSFISSRTDNTINFDWGSASPQSGVPLDLFSATFSGNFAFESGEYTFTIVGDDGTRLYIDGVKIDDQWNDHSATTYKVNKTMTAGSHLVTLEFYENGGEAVVYLSWAKNGITSTNSTNIVTSNANEPSGMTKITETNFNTLTEDGWTTGTYSGSVASIIQDPAAPKSPGSVAQIPYPVGLPGGQGVALITKNLNSNSNTLYISVWNKLSTNWVGHPSTGAGKLLYVALDDKNVLIPELNGAGSDPVKFTLIPIGLDQPYPWYPNMFGQPGSDTNPTLHGNLADPDITRGAWHHYEIVMSMGTYGTANGRLEAWVDGVKTHDFSNIDWRPAGTPGRFTWLQWSPIWGGGGDNITKEQYQYMDNIYVSGKDTTSSNVTTLSNDHEPSGFTLVTERAFNSIQETGWDWYGTTQPTIVQDSTAQKSKSSVGRVTYNSGFVGGNGQGQVCNILSQQKSIYISTWLELSSGFEGHQTGANKLFYISFNNNKGFVVPEAEGVDLNPLEQTIVMQNLAANYQNQNGAFGTTVVRRQNVDTSVKIVRGQWSHYEYVLTMNTPGVADGSIEAWQDGKQTFSLKNITFLASTEGQWGWGSFCWQPIWGGQSDVPVKNTFYMEMDHAYISAKTSNEPSGMNVISSRNENSLNEVPWLDSGTFTIVNDATVSDGKVGRFYYPKGYSSLSDPGASYVSGTQYLGNSNTLYQRFQVKFDQNWQGHYATGNNKLTYTKYEGGELGFIFEAQGSGSDPLYPVIYPYGLGADYLWSPSGIGGAPVGYASTSPQLGANLVNKEITRGVWHAIEILTKVGTPGVADGTLEIWIDGVKTHEYKNIMWRKVGASSRYETTGLIPIWGGSGSTLTQDQYLYVDSYYISGK